ncbi:MAG: universal stress protein [Pseudomonadota bacterium]
MSEQVSRAGQRTFLVIVDESPEMHNALRYACRRAKRTGGRVAMLYVMDPPEGQQWGAVVDLMRQEARQHAEEVIAKHSDVAISLTGQPPTIHIREGKSREEVVKLLGEDRSISVLVLGSSSSSEGPGPLVTAFAGKLGGQLRIPLTIVPGALTEAEIDAIS